MLRFRKNNAEIQLLLVQFNEVMDEGSWHGKAIKTLLAEVDPARVFEKPGGQHSILELVWHMTTWKEFALDRLQRSNKDLAHFEAMDWRQLDHGNTALWTEGLDRFWQTHQAFMALLAQQTDKLLDEVVPGRKYNYRKLLHGVRDHDIYHSGQIIYIQKLLKGQQG